LGSFQKWQNSNIGVSFVAHDQLLYTCTQEGTEGTVDNEHLIGKL